MNQRTSFFDPAGGYRLNDFGALMAHGLRPEMKTIGSLPTLPFGVGLDKTPHGLSEANWYWKASAAVSFSPREPRQAAPDPDPDDELDVEPDPDPEEENEADINPSSNTTRSGGEGGTRGGDGTINPPFP